MVGKNYKPATAKLENGRVRVSREYLLSLGIDGGSDQKYLHSKLLAEAICPRIYWFADEPRIRELLKFKEETNG